jgi:hypothetical protein
MNERVPMIRFDRIEVVRPSNEPTTANAVGGQLLKFFQLESLILAQSER